MVGASAAAIPLRDNSVDIVHARFAYFFGPGCEPGISEVERILKPGGTAFIIDNDLTAGTFARWIHAAYGRSPKHGAAIEDFWRQKGFTVDRLTSCWRFDCREDFEWVVRLEFPAEHARRFVADHSGLEVDYNVLLIHRTY